jgi:O-acetyl-ADP-ribose deacetylase (regulator of RNase III)
VIIYVKRDISTISKGVVAHGVNCQGVMGSGVAASLRSAYPQIFTTYKKICDDYENNPNWMMLGLVDIVEVSGEFEDELLIVNCFTQERYGRDGKVYADAKAVFKSLDQAIELADGLALPFFMPKIGCGLGGLSWEHDVEVIVEALSVKHRINVHVCTI